MAAARRATSSTAPIRARARRRTRSSWPRSENLPGRYLHAVPEDLLTHVSTWNGEPVEDLVRADMTYFETPNGGAVFSVGSITFCGSLSHNDYDNNVSRIVDNVLRRFRDT